MLQEIYRSFIENGDLLRELLLSHLEITSLTVMMAIVIGLLIGVMISEKRKIAGVIIGIVNVVYTIPSIALLGILITITGIGNLMAIMF